MADYVRQLPDQGSRDMARRPSTVSRFHIDVPLLLLLMLLTAYGLLVLYSASGENMDAVVRQGRYFALAYVIMLLGAQISLARYARWAPWLYGLGVATLVAVVFAGVGAKGAQRWLEVGGLRFQPSEIMKLGVPLVIASFLAGRALPPGFLSVIGALALLLVPAGLIVIQPDLGTSLLIAASGLFVLFMAGIGWLLLPDGQQVPGDWGTVDEDSPPWNIGPESSIALGIACFFDVPLDFEVPDSYQIGVEFISASGKRYAHTFSREAPVINTGSKRYAQAA